MSIITSLIIFSGSSARSIISFRLARINVLTLSKSPMTFLLSNRLRIRNTKLEMRCYAAACGGTGRVAETPNHYSQQAGYVCEAERCQLLHRVDRASPKKAGGEGNPYGAKDPQH